MIKKTMTQREFVETTLLRQGYITRNECIVKYIYRLSAIIYVLKRKGWVIETKKIPVMTSWGIGFNYKYKLLHSPYEI